MSDDGHVPYNPKQKSKKPNSVVSQALQERESRWTASMQADPTSRARLRSDIPDSQPAWMSPSQGLRLHWSQRQKQQQEQQPQLQQAQQVPSDKATINDTLDVLEAATLSNQIGAGFGSLLARDTLTGSAQSCGGGFCMAA